MMVHKEGVWSGSLLGLWNFCGFRVLGYLRWLGKNNDFT